MEVSVNYPVLPGDAVVPIVSCGGEEVRIVNRGGSPNVPGTKCSYPKLGSLVPTLVIADYQVLGRPEIEVLYLRGHDAAAASYADEAEKIVPLITEWFGAQREKAKTADLPDPNAAPFESGALLLEK